MTIKKHIILKEILELHRLRFLENFVTNVREVEHIGQKMNICETMTGSTKVFDYDKYEQIGTYDNKPLYQNKKCK
jgi:hypothetical protein